MKCKIVCKVCKEVLGVVEKVKIDENDVKLFNETMQCSNEHTESIELVEISENK
jgi:hypothetical protein